MRGAIQPDVAPEKGVEVEKDHLALLAFNKAIRMADEESKNEDSDYWSWSIPNRVHSLSLGVDICYSKKPAKIQVLLSLNFSLDIYS